MKPKTPPDNRDVTEGSFMAVDRSRWRKVFEIVRKDDAQLRRERIWNQPNLCRRFQSTYEWPGCWVEHPLLGCAECQSARGANSRFQRVACISVEAGRYINR